MYLHMSRIAVAYTTVTHKHQITHGTIIDKTWLSVSAKLYEMQFPTYCTLIVDVTLYVTSVICTEFLSFFLVAIIRTQ